MNILTSIRERFNMVIGAGVGAFFFFSCGALLTFVVAPRQAAEARRIERLPNLEPVEIKAAPSGQELLFTGWLIDNPIAEEGGYVAYRLDEWRVEPPDEDEEEPTGDWILLETYVPRLAINVNDATVHLQPNNQARLSGPVSEELFLSHSTQQAKYNNEWLPEGTVRIRGFYNGDLTTVLGKQGSAGGVVPEELFAGDRDAFIKAEKDAAKGLLIGGIFMLACSPLVLMAGVVGAVLGRRR